MGPQSESGAEARLPAALGFSGVHVSSDGLLVGVGLAVHKAAVVSARVVVADPHHLEQPACRVCRRLHLLADLREQDGSSLPLGKVGGGRLVGGGEGFDIVAVTTRR
jgi:hypothetical protein